MPVTNYYSVSGEILGEETSGVRRDYLTDALGSVTATVTSAGAIENTYRYKPYGAQLSKTGTAADPAFTWVGKWGYRQTSKAYSGVYVRARYYSELLGVWNNFDPINFQSDQESYVLRKFIRNIKINGFIYANNNSVKIIDSSGLYPAWIYGTSDDPNLSPEKVCKKPGLEGKSWCDVSLSGSYAATVALTCVKGSCIESIVFKHEMTHVDNINPCCRSLSICLLKGLDRYKCNMAYLMYEKWQICEWEYLAYTAGLEEAQRLQKSDCMRPKNMYWQFCCGSVAFGTIPFEIINARKQIEEAKKHRRMGIKCPIRSDGSISEDLFQFLMNRRIIKNCNFH